MKRTSGLWRFYPLRYLSLIWFYRHDWVRIVLETMLSWYALLLGQRYECDREYEKFLEKRRRGNPERDLGRVEPLDPSFLQTRRAKVERVVIFAEAFWPKVDGVTRAAYLTLCHLKQTGREVLVFAPDIAPERVYDCEVVPLPSACLGEVPKTRMVLSTPKTRRIIEEKLDAFEPDIIQLFSPAMFSDIGIRYAKRRGIPVVANYQTDLPSYLPFYFINKVAPDKLRSSLWVRKTFFYVTRKTFSVVMHRTLRYMHNRCAINLVPTYAILQELQQQGYKRLYVWRRGVDVRKFNPVYQDGAWRERLLNGRNPHALLCIYVGRIDYEKHLDLLVEVAKTEGVALTFIGDGASLPETAKLFAGTGTYFIGRLSGEDLSAAYASADVFVFPSPTETFGQVVQEAMASGLPTVVINQGGVADLVEDGKTGYLCPDDPQAFVSAVCKLRDNPKLREQMAENARRHAENYPWEKIMQQLESYYATAQQINDQQRRNKRLH